MELLDKTQLHVPHDDHFSIVMGKSWGDNNAPIPYGTAPLHPPAQVDCETFAATYPIEKHMRGIDFNAVMSPTAKHVSCVVIRKSKCQGEPVIRIGVGRAEEKEWVQGSPTVHLWRELIFSSVRRAVDIAPLAFQACKRGIQGAGPSEVITRRYDPGACAVKARSQQLHPEWAPYTAFAKFVRPRVLEGGMHLAAAAVEACSTSSTEFPSIAIRGEDVELAGMWGPQESGLTACEWGTRGKTSCEEVELLSGLERMEHKNIESLISAVARLSADAWTGDSQHFYMLEKEFCCRDGVWQLYDANKNLCYSNPSLLASFRYATGCLPLQRSTIQRALRHLPFAHERQAGLKQADDNFHQIQYWQGVEAARATTVHNDDYAGLVKWVAGEQATKCALPSLLETHPAPWISKCPHDTLVRNQGRQGCVSNVGLNGTFTIAWGDGRPPRVSILERKLAIEPNLVRLFIDNKPLAAGVDIPSIDALVARKQLHKADDGWYEITHTENAGSFKAEALAWGQNWQLQVYF
jgi:hypothetical protein